MNKFCEGGRGMAFSIPIYELRNLSGFRKSGLMTLIISFFCFQFVCLGQGIHQDRTDGIGEIKPLRVGEKVPEEFWTREHLFYIDGDTVRKSLEDYRGVPIILDFWATWCGACIANFSNLEKIKESFPEEINILLVNASYTKDNYKKIHKAYQTTVPSQWSGGISTILLDDYLSFKFPHIAVPFYVWLSKNGVLKALTRSSFVGIKEVDNYLKR